ncbi:hypothetical protein EPA93_11075 [Ktedonosporobacter rubrisoli]|uniref:DUF2127 domain-containing protein n=1 Tax=Ktedonosporobacter rubrisoli TaxID=2509675 RepID=A0A4P6JN63_KTERU|nr:hypothetical protein [Ktedonosporobacter rubrisoli]QBD76520.1 hypothetical protein EPA93_11075 [Ktedonosporobacter rubrisoli]
MTDMLPKRPLGITIVAILMIVQGIASIIFSLIFLLQSAQAMYAFYGNGEGVLSNALLGCIFVIIGVVSFFVAWGLWKLQFWAYWATIGLEIIGFLAGIAEIATSSTPLWTIIGDVILTAAILIYFFVDANVRATLQPYRVPEQGL